MADECVVDANVFIDFVEGAIFPTFARAGLTIMTTDFVVGDMDTPTRPELETIGIRVLGLDGPQIAHLTDLAPRYRKPSLADLSALVLAEHRKIILLTGDGDLRSAAGDLGVEVHGTIWILDRMIDNGALSERAAAAALARMVKRGRRLPATVVRKRLDTWK